MKKERAGIPLKVVDIAFISSACISLANLSRLVGSVVKLGCVCVISTGIWIDKGNF